MCPNPRSSLTPTQLLLQHLNDLGISILRHVLQHTWTHMPPQLTGNLHRGIPHLTTPMRKSFSYKLHNFTSIKGTPTYRRPPILTDSQYPQ